MKKLITMILTVALALSMTGCASEEVKAVRAGIDAIGTVTLDSEEAIVAAREAYDALPPEEQAKVKNYDVLVAAEQQLEVVRCNQNTLEYLGELEQVLPLLDEIYSWVNQAWANANAMNQTMFDGIFDGSQMASMLDNCQLMTNAYSVENSLPYFLDADSVNLLKLQSWAMHITDFYPQYYSEMTAERLTPAYEKNARLYELRKLQQELVPLLEETAVNLQSWYNNLGLSEHGFAVERVSDALFHYNTVVFNDIGGYSCYEDYVAACDAARAEVEAAISALQALMEG